MKLERELHAVVYWFLGLGVYIGATLGLFVIAVWLYPEVASETLLGITALATSLVATKGRYGKLSVTNFLIFLAIAFIPLLNLFAIPYYIGKGFWMLVTRQKPIIEE